MGWVAERGSPAKWASADVLKPYNRSNMHFKELLSAWWSHWLTRISGPATVPLAVLALYVSSHTLRALYAVLCAGFTSYKIWLNERIALEAERDSTMAGHLIDGCPPPQIEGFATTSISNRVFSAR